MHVYIALSQVIGAGPTGVEFTGELTDLIGNDVPRLFPELIGFINLTVVSSGKVLPMFEEVSDPDERFLPSTLLMHAATAVVAVAFHPLVVQKALRPRCRAIATLTRLEKVDGMRTIGTWVGSMPLLDKCPMGGR